MVTSSTQTRANAATGRAQPLRYDSPRPRRMDVRPRLFIVNGPIFMLPLKPDFETLIQLLRPVRMRRWYRNPMSAPWSLFGTNVRSGGGRRVRVGTQEGNS